MCLVYKKLKVNCQSPPHLLQFSGSAVKDQISNYFRDSFCMKLSDTPESPYSQNPWKMSNTLPPPYILKDLMTAETWHFWWTVYRSTGIFFFFPLDMMIRWDFYFFNLMKLMRWNDPKEMETIFPPSVESFMELSFKESNITYSLW